MIRHVHLVEFLLNVVLANTSEISPATQFAYGFEESKLIAKMMVRFAGPVTAAMTLFICWHLEDQGLLLISGNSFELASERIQGK